MNQDIKRRLDDAFFNIIKLPLGSQKVMDLKKIWKNCGEIWQEMSKEDVICRRLGKQTPHYLELEAELLTGIDLLEQYLTFATLLS